jgi:hypothetical protein
MRHVYFIRGFSPFKKYKNRVITLNNTKLFERCHPESWKLVVDISEDCLIKKTRINAFIKKIEREVKKSLNDGHSVHLHGHSYGGAVALYLLNKINNRRLHIYTYGSIHIVDPSMYNRHKVTQYMMTGDVVLRCNQIKPPAKLQMRKEYLYDIFGKPLKLIKTHYENGITWMKMDGNEAQQHYGYPISDITHGYIKN